MTPHVAAPIFESRTRQAMRLGMFHFATYLYPLRARVTPRRFHAFGIGIGKTGTHSLAGIFQTRYRAAHQPQSQLTQDWIHSYQTSSDTLPTRAFLLQRDRALWLELEASTYLTEILPELVVLFPNAKFILTLRDCYTWLNSVLNYALQVRQTERGRRARERTYGQNGRTYTAGDEILESFGLYSIHDYLAGWAQRNARALEFTPAERLLVIRTHELTNSLPQIAQFLNLPIATLDARRTHLYKAPTDFEILRRVDREYLESQVQLHCQPLMRQFFPEIQRLEDAFPIAPAGTKH